MEESRTIKVTLEQAREWYNSDNLALRTQSMQVLSTLRILRMQKKQ